MKEIENIYKEKYVVFIDILGFKSHVEYADKDKEKQQEVLRILNLVRYSLCDDPRIDMRLTHFSDCIVFSVDRCPACLWAAVSSISVLTRNLLQYGYLVRGGLVVGGLHHDSQFLYGVAMNHAYDLESKAQFPRTIISEEVMNDIKDEDKSLSGWIRQDTDGAYFVNYLRSYAEYDPDDMSPGTERLEKSGLLVANLFYNHLIDYKNDECVLGKYQWFQTYWNDSIVGSRVFKRIEDGNTKCKVEGFPNIIVLRRIA